MLWTVGAVTVTSIVETGGPTPAEFLYPGMGGDEVLQRATAAPWLRPHFVDDDGMIDLRIQCLVVESGDRTIAVDTCIGNDKRRAVPNWDRMQTTFLADMTAAGFPPDAVDTVVCTHLHVDHVGWNTRLVDGEWVPTFPNAEYLFVRTEFDHWRGRIDPTGDDVFGDSVAPVHDAGLAVLVEPGHRVTDEVTLLPTPGHTPGHVSVEIRSEGDRAIITGDMAHSPLQIADPDLGTGFDSDTEAAIATRWRVFPEWVDALVIGTHFGGPGGGVMAADGERFRLDV